MFTDQHISMDTCIQIDGACPLAVQVVGDQAEIRFGTGHVLSVLLDDVQFTVTDIVSVPVRG
jgi:hypothetical protein